MDGGKRIEIKWSNTVYVYRLKKKENNDASILNLGAKK